MRDMPLTGWGQQSEGKRGENKHFEEMCKAEDWMIHATRRSTEVP
jgi:hypothetical protein